MAATSPIMHRLLAALSPGRPTNASTLCRRLELEPHDVEEALAALERDGLVECRGKRVVSNLLPDRTAEATLLYAALSPDGATKGNICLRAALGFDEATYLRAKQELVDAMLVRPGLGKGGTLARIPVGQSQPSKPSPGGEAPSAGMSQTASRILAALPSDGSTAGNIRLRSRLSIEDDTYAAAKQELLDEGLVRAGIGRGGTLARIEAQSDTQKRAGGRLVRLEKELYEPFADWLRRNLADEQGTKGFRFGHVFVSATPGGHRRSSGQWSRPDVTQIRVVSYEYEYLPAVDIEVSAYEIKPNSGAEKLESVYEAAAHGRWAHNANLVVELESEEATVSDTISSEASRLGIGLYTMHRREDGRFRVRQEVESQPLKEPELKNIEGLLENTFKDDKDLRIRYSRAIR